MIKVLRNHLITVAERGGQWRRNVQLGFFQFVLMLVSLNLQ